MTAISRPARQRQQAVVLQQHDGLGRGLPGQRVVRVGVEGLVQLQHRHALGDQLQHRADPGVEDLERHLAGLDGGDDRLGAAAQGRRHLQVEPGQQRRHPVVDRAPVGHDQALEPELLAQHGGEQPGVLRRGDAVDLVVGAHHRPRLRRR